VLWSFTTKVYWTPLSSSSLVARRPSAGPVSPHSLWSRSSLLPPHLPCPVCARRFPRPTRPSNYGNRSPCRLPLPQTPTGGDHLSSPPRVPTAPDRAHLDAASHLGPHAKASSPAYLKVAATTRAPSPNPSHPRALVLPPSQTLAAPPLSISSTVTSPQSKRPLGASQGGKEHPGAACTRPHTSNRPNELAEVETPRRSALPRLVPSLSRPRRSRLPNSHPRAACFILVLPMCWIVYPRSRSILAGELAVVRRRLPSQSAAALMLLLTSAVGSRSNRPDQFDQDLYRSTRSSRRCFSKKSLHSFSFKNRSSRSRKFFTI
jgi:hypothetical protein